MATRRRKFGGDAPFHPILQVQSLRQTSNSCLLNLSEKGEDGRTIIVYFCVNYCEFGPTMTTRSRKFRFRTRNLRLSTEVS
jgi:hypothetical protein